MSITADYSRSHAAFLDVAKQHDVDPFDVRLLVALVDNGPERLERDLAADLRTPIEAIRRSARRLAERGMVRRRSVSQNRTTRMVLRLGDAGSDVAATAIQAAVA